MEFDWPVNKVWAGFQNPYTPDPCYLCNGSGCKYCNYTGKCIPSKEKAEAYEQWEPIDPPIGDGFQMWEMCTEGSPQSPIFATAEELAAYCEKRISVCGDTMATKEQWLKWIEQDVVGIATTMCC